MKWVEENTKEQIYSQLLREMKYWFPEIPDSSDRLDPVLRLLLGAFAHQIEKLNQKINATWDQTFRSLVRTVFVEGLRWPVPASTVMKVDPTDEILELDTSVRFLYKDEKEERNFIFSPWGKVKLLKAELGLAYYSTGEDLFLLSSFGKDKYEKNGERRVVPLSNNIKASAQFSNQHTLYLGIRYNRSALDFSDVPIFFHTDEDALHQIRWGRWFLSSPDGYFFKESSFCPGVDAQQNLKSFDSPQKTFVFLGGLGKSEDLFKSFADYFFYLPPSHLARWGSCQIPSDLQKFVSAGLLGEQSKNSEKLFWIKIDLSEKGDKTSFADLKEIYFNCFLAINKKDLTFFKHTAGNQLLEVELPEECSTIFSIDSVVDSNNREYQNRLNLSFSKTPFSYITEERNGHVVLWFDFTNYPGSGPNSISVYYSTTFGSLGNGIEAGKIEQLWERHPGIRSVTNILPTSGGMPAKTTEELLLEVSSLLRNRGRAVSFEEIEYWTKLFDSRITSAECKNVIRMGPQGAFRCTRVNVRVK
ncbi:MAG: hypothetical protein ACE5KJ_06090, partial [Candidatus Zixiibacteriota bacterium]